MGPRRALANCLYLTSQKQVKPSHVNSSRRLLNSTKHRLEIPASSSAFQHHCRNYSTHGHPTITIENGETIINSAYPDIRKDHRSFGEFMFSFLDEFKTHDLMVDYPSGRAFTGGAMKELSIKVGSGLHRLGYKKGDVVLLFATNCPEYTVLFLACGAIGVTVSTANPIYTPGELARQLAHCGAKGVFTIKAMLPTVKEALSSNQEAAGNIKDIFIMDGEADKCRPLSSLLEDSGSAFPENVDIDPHNTILTLPYSSGTTGLPKGVMLSHFNMVSNLLQAKEGQVRFRTGEVLMGLLPFYHIYGLMVLQFLSLTQGAKVIVHPKFEPEAFLQSIQDHKVSYVHLVPPLIQFLYKTELSHVDISSVNTIVSGGAPLGKDVTIETEDKLGVPILQAKHPMIDQYDLTSLNVVVSAAAPLGTGVTKEVEARLGVSLIQAYGLTECSPLTHYDEIPHRRGTIGRLVPSTIAKIIDPLSGEALGVGETGEILLKGPQVMMGYLNNQEATDDTIKGDWLYTGDIGHADEEGYFTISDRIKELIKYKGYQVAPAELEALLCTHPHIQDAAVIGLAAGEEVGEVPRAFVVVKPDHDLPEHEVLEFVEKNVAPYKKLRGGVEFISEVPKTASGKILRRMLKK